MHLALCDFGASLPSIDESLKDLLGLAGKPPKLVTFHENGDSPRNIDNAN